MFYGLFGVFVFVFESLYFIFFSQYDFFLLSLKKFEFQINDELLVKLGGFKKYKKKKVKKGVEVVRNVIVKFF